MIVKPQHVLMAIVSLIVCGCAIAGTMDYWFYQIGDTDLQYTRYSLWKYTTKSATTDLVTYKVNDDNFLQLTCGEFADRFALGEAFAVLTSSTSFFAFVGFIMNIAGVKIPFGVAMAFITIIFSLATWVIVGVLVYRQEFCPNSAGVNQIHLDQNNHIGVGFEYHRGFYFFFFPWILYFLCSIAAIVMTCMGVGGDAEEKEEEGKEKNSEGVEQNPRGVVSHAPYAGEEGKNKAQDDKKKAAAAKKKAEDEKAAAARKKKAEDDKKKSDDEKRKKAAAAKKKAEEEKAAAARKKKAEDDKKKSDDEKAAAARRKREKVDIDEEEFDEEMAKKLNAEDVERRKKIWAGLRERLPADKKDKTQRRQRFDLFKDFDRGGKKHLTPADLSRGCQVALGLGQLKKGLAHILPMAHANARATRQARGAPAKRVSNEKVQRCEFRLVFVHIKKLFDLWFIFDTLDATGAGFITDIEFKASVEPLKKWGKRVINPKLDFESVVHGSHGKMSFAQFCDYAMAKQAVEHFDDTDDDEEPEEEDEEEARLRNLANVARRKKIWADLAHRLPTNKKSKEERARRFAYFREFDVKGNGFLTLADVEAGCETVLGLGQLGTGLHNLLPLAYNSALNVTNVKGQNFDVTQHVEKLWMRLLFVYIHQYFDLWFLFDTLDVTSRGSISLKEFTKGLPEVEKWAGVMIKDAPAEFAAADVCKTGQLIFLEFCEWAHHKNPKDE